MKSKSIYQQKNHQHTDLPLSFAVLDPNQNETNSAATPQAAAKEAYFIYLSQGSSFGRDLQEAKAQLRAERYRILIHGFATRDQLTHESPGKQGGDASAAGRWRQSQAQL
jgi:hypothetical protein